MSTTAIARSLGLALGLLILSAPTARAQDTRAEIAGGYSALYDNELGDSFPAGWFVGAGANFNRMFAIVGEVSGNYKSASATTSIISASASLNVHAFVGGPRVMVHPGPVTVFGEFLIGAASASGAATASGAVGAPINVSASQTNLCFQPGFGIDADFDANIAFRAQANFRVITSSAGSANEFQFLAGVVYRFRK